MIGAAPAHRKSGTIGSHKSRLLPYMDGSPLPQGEVGNPLRSVTSRSREWVRPRDPVEEVRRRARNGAVELLRRANLELERHQLATICGGLKTYRDKVRKLRLPWVGEDRPLGANPGRAS